MIPVAKIRLANSVETDSPSSSNWHGYLQAAHEIGKYPEKCYMQRCAYGSSHMHRLHPGDTGFLVFQAITAVKAKLAH